MNIIKLILEKISTGFLYGLGFCAIVLIISFATSKYFASEYNPVDSKNDNKCRSYEDCPDEAKLALTITTERISADEFILLGDIKNNGEMQWDSVKIKAELFDEKNNFIDECTEYLSQKIKPGQKLNFKMSCTECSKVQLENYHHYKVSIIDGNNW